MGNKNSFKKLLLAVNTLVAIFMLSSCGEMPEKKEAKTIPDGIYENARPALYNNSQNVLFSGTYNGKTAIYTTDISGKSFEEIISHKYGLVSPAIDNAGERITFTVDLTGDGRGFIGMSKINGRSYRRITMNKSNTKVYDRKPSFTPDGKSIIFQRSSKHGFIQEFWRVDLASMEEQKVMDELAWHPTPAVFTPDGEKMLFGQMIKMTFEGDKKIFPYRIFEYNFVENKLNTVGLLGRNNPCLSPDGKNLVYTGTDDAALFISDREGKNPRRLFYAEYKCKSPQYSKDGRHIIFLHFKEKWSQKATIGILHVITKSYREVIPVTAEYKGD